MLARLGRGLARLVVWLSRAFAPARQLPRPVGPPRKKRRARTRPARGALVTSGASRTSGEGRVVVVPIEDSMDLHTFAPRDVASVVDEYVREAAKRGLREVRVIHGRGKGVQRQVTRSVLARHPDVLEFGDAPATRGGWGAQIATLRARKTRPKR